MPFVALGFLGVAAYRALAAAYILAVRDGIQVPWIHAARIPAEMVEFQLSRNRAS